MHDSSGTQRVRWFLIAATDRSRLRGIVEAVGMRLPCYLSDDVGGVKRLAPGCPVVMGRRTYESLGGPLPGRLNVVLTRRTGFSPSGVVVARDAAAVRQALLDESALGVPEALLVGGAVVFGQFLPEARHLRLTEIGRTFDGNCLFARFARGGSKRVGWRQAERERHYSDHGFEYDFVVYEQRRIEECQEAVVPA